MLYIKLGLTALVLFLSTLVGAPVYAPINDVSGSVVIEVIDEEGIIIIYDEFNFNEDDNLFYILRDNYNIEYVQYSIGIVLLCIENLCTNFENNYIAIYINGEYSFYGVYHISLKDAAKYSFIYTNFN